MTKKLKFDDTTGIPVNIPTNMNLWLVLFVTYANGSSSNTYVTSNISYVVNHEYEDA